MDCDDNCNLDINKFKNLFLKILLKREIIYLTKKQKEEYLL